MLYRVLNTDSCRFLRDCSFTDILCFLKILLNDEKVLINCGVSVDQVFLSAIWLLHSQLWAMIEGIASFT